MFPLWHTSHSRHTQSPSCPTSTSTFKCELWILQFYVFTIINWLHSVARGCSETQPEKPTLNTRLQADDWGLGEEMSFPSIVNYVLAIILLLADCITGWPASRRASIAWQGSGLSTGCLLVSSHSLWLLIKTFYKATSILDKVGKWKIFCSLVVEERRSQKGKRQKWKRKERKERPAPSQCHCHFTNAE